MELKFNPNLPAKMHIDLNSCFASVEQQANPFLRGKPVAVAAYNSSRGCILASSVEAKEMGVKTGMRVFEGKALCPGLIVLETDVEKYRNVHLKLKKLLLRFCPDVFPKSIDEFTLDFSSFNFGQRLPLSIKNIAREIKRKIRTEVGDFLTVSIGISTNRYLAKIASNLKKPDGLEVINFRNFFLVYKDLKLSDLTGIKFRNSLRLNTANIYTVEDFFKSSLINLKKAFPSICSYYWYLRLRGYEIDDFASDRKTFGNSYALPRSLKNNEEIFPILCKLVEKTGFRMRSAGFSAKGVHLAISFRDRSFWHKGKLFPGELLTSTDIYKKALFIMKLCPKVSPVREIAISVFSLSGKDTYQLSFFEDNVKRVRTIEACDTVNKRWGNFVLTPARVLRAQSNVPERIAFGLPD